MIQVFVDFFSTIYCTVPVSFPAIIASRHSSASFRLTLNSGYAGWLAVLVRMLKVNLQGKNIISEDGDDWKNVVLND